jgi:effector-binding domain-containing protein
MKKILYILISLVAIYLILCLFGPSTMKVERSIEIKASAEIIKSKITDLKFFNETWSPWTEKDPGMNVTYTGDMGKVGSSMSWVSEKEEVGKGSMTFKGIHGDTIVESLFFEGQGEAHVYHIVSPNINGSTVSWIMQNDVPFAFRAIMLFMNIDKMVGPDFEKGLAKLKVAMESMSPETQVTVYEVKEIKWEEKTYVGKREVISTENNDMSKMTAFFSENLPKLFSDLGKNKIEPASSPGAIFFKWEEKQTDVAAAIAIPNGKEVKGWEKWMIPASDVLHVAYYGSDEGSINAHNTIAEYMAKNKKEKAYVIEEYVTNREVEKDPAKWLTNIFYVLK